MHNNEKLFKKKFEKVIVDVELNRIDLKLIKLDRELETFCKNFNLLSSLKPSSDDGYESETSILLDSYQVPMLVCKTQAGYYRLVSGFFTYQKLCKLFIGRDEKNTVPCLVLPKRPSQDLLRLIMLNDVVRPLLKQFVDVNGTTVTESLTAWFTNDDQPSVFNSVEWQSLFPLIKTKTELCAWLHISTKTVKLK